jgi:hypothetical protein
MTLPAPTHLGRLCIESRHLPAAQGGGGDIHDVMATPFGIRLLIGDVMGRGLAANRTGLCVLNAWRELAGTEPSLAAIAVRLQALIARSEHPERFVTALLVNFPGGDAGGVGQPGLGQPGRADGSRADGSRAELVCCGHPPPLLLRGGSAAFVEPCAAPPLGLLDLAGGWCEASMIPICEGDQLLLYTDGVSEARDSAGRFFPLAERTARVLDSGCATGPHLLDALLASLNDHVGDRATDDILLLLVRLRLSVTGLRPLRGLEPGDRGRPGYRELGHCYRRAGGERPAGHETIPWGTTTRGGWTWRSHRCLSARRGRRSSGITMR